MSTALGATFSARGVRRADDPRVVARDETALYPYALSLVVTADGGGRKGPRLWLWQVELQRQADGMGFPITVCHLSPDTSEPGVPTVGRDAPRARQTKRGANHGGDSRLSR